MAARGARAGSGTTPNGHQRNRTAVGGLGALGGGRGPIRLAAAYILATLGCIALTAALLPFRDTTTPLSEGFGFLVVVVVAASVGGLGPGMLASVLGFLMFNFYFIPPYGTFAIGRREDVIVLFVFLGLSILVSALLARATERAEAAEARERELRTLQGLSAELVAVGPGPGSYERVLSVLVRVFDLSAGALFVQDPETPGLREQTVVGCGPGELLPRSDLVSSDVPLERLPLSVGGRNLGLIVLRRNHSSRTPAETRVLRAFCDQFALVLERDRLLKEATQAQIYRQAESVRRSLLAAVSHDLRTPLAAIKASVTDLLSDDSPREGAYLRDALESIDGETDRLTSLIANLLDMTKIERGMLKAHAQGVDLTELLSQCVDRARRQWPDLKIGLTVDPKSALVRADPVFLDRVVTNLLDNAAKAATDNKADSVELDVRGNETLTTVRVIDHGRGIPSAAREQLFYPFYQLNERHPRLGTGLGLPIAKGFLALMGGEIWIENTPGGGSTFAFSLPPHDLTPAAEAAAPR